MTPVERSDRQSDAPAPEKPQEGLGIIATPFGGEQPQVTHTPDGGFTIYLRGEIHIAYRPPAADALESPVPDAETPSNGLLPETTVPPVTEQNSTSDSASPPLSETKDHGATKQENELHEFVGNPTYD